MPTGVYTRTTGHKLSEEHKQKLRDAKRRFFDNGGKTWCQGKKLSKEHIKKLSDSHLGQRPWMVGKKHTDETKLKISLKKRGKPSYTRTEESNKNVSISKLGKPRFDMRGENNPFWKGGLTALNYKVRYCLEYKEWRRIILKRDNYTCQMCLKRGGKLQVDHIKQFARIMTENKITSLEMARNCEELWNINNGRVLCLPCHKTTPTYLKGGLTNI